MTIIAWDGETLAADRQSTANGYAHTVTKIHRLDADRLVAFAGSLSRAVEVVEWLRRNGPASEFPAGTEDEWITVLVIHRDGRVIRHENRGTGWQIHDRFTACGSGRDYALAAMHLGKSAEGAVAITCELSTECGKGIDALRFDPVTP